MERRRWWRSPLLWAIVLVVLWLTVGGPLGSYQGRLAEVQENDNSAFLPATAEATRVAELEARFTDGETLPAVVVFTRDGGLSEADLAAVAQVAEEFAGVAGVTGESSPPVVSPDGAAAQLVVPLASDIEAGETVAELRELAAAGTPDQVDTYVTGPAGFAADLGEAFGNIDGLLLVVTASVVALILLVVYRSPLLPLVVLFGAGLALGTASAVVYALVEADLVVLNGQSQGIMLILVFGAATDYALLLVARYREELRRYRDRFTAVRVAWRRSLGPIVASGSTVILALLCLLLSDLNSNKGLGPVAAVGVASAMLVMLTFLPAALALLGRVGFWPFRPAYGSEADHQGGLWERVAGLVSRRARLVWLVTALALAGLAALVPQLRADGTAESDLFLGEVEAVTGQDELSEHFPAGSTAPTVVVANAAQTEPVVAALSEVDGVAEVRPEGERDGLARIAVVLANEPDSDEAIATIPRLRAAARSVPEADALVGGTSAIAYDTRQAASRDQRVIIPLALLVVFVVIALLLRAILVTVLLLASVVLSFAATLGLAAVVFNNIFHFPGADRSIPLFAFVFLVALGVDYSIFLLTRVREETRTRGTREGVRVGLAVTGAVITSAGIVLAATFSALAVIPLLFLAQIAFLVAVGVLIDTLIVRSLLVPGLCHDIGDRIWWPSRLGRAQPEPH
ncbi:MAG TPA: MMPL family transporter [Natronosporangium sp.]